MYRFTGLIAICFASAGCTGAPVQETTPVYEAVLRHELKEAAHVKDIYVTIDGKDPSPETLKRLQEQCPGAQPGSQAPQGNATHVGVRELKWIDRNTAELRGGFSNGMDGRGSHYHVIKKNGQWVVDRAVVSEVSFISSYRSGSISLNSTCLRRINHVTLRLRSERRRCVRPPQRLA
jgi:hypothetical protein